MTTAPPIAGRSRVRIDWSVAAFDGTAIGKATQENEMPARRLGGNWSEVAPKAAESAVEGIRVMLEPPRRSRRGRAIPPMPPTQEDVPSTPGRAPAPGKEPPTTKLPQLPGRALPPE